MNNDLWPCNGWPGYSNHLQRIFAGDALLRRMVRLGLLLESEKKLDYVLGLTTAKIMERRLQTKARAIQN